MLEGAVSYIWSKKQKQKQKTKNYKSIKVKKKYEHKFPQDIHSPELPQAQLPLPFGKIKTGAFLFLMPGDSGK